MVDRSVRGLTWKCTMEVIAMSDAAPLTKLLGA
jgi:hypothetical protein